jgi:hypothetical protein
MMIWLLYIRFIVPVLGVSTDGAHRRRGRRQDDYLSGVRSSAAPSCSQIPAYLVCTTLLVLPSVMLVFLIVPTGGGSIAQAFPSLVADLGMLVVAQGLRRRLRPGRDAPGRPLTVARLCVRLGAGGAAVSGLPETADGRLLRRRS